MTPRPMFLTPKEVAHELRITDREVVRMLRAGELSGNKFGDSSRARWRIPSRALDEWANRTRYHAAA